MQKTTLRAETFAGRNFREVKKSRNLANLSFANFDFDRNFTDKTFTNSLKCTVFCWQKLSKPVKTGNLLPTRNFRIKGSKSRKSRKFLPLKYFLCISSTSSSTAWWNHGKIIWCVAAYWSVECLILPHFFQRVQLSHFEWHIHWCWYTRPLSFLKSFSCCEVGRRWWILNHDLDR